MFDTTAVPPKGFKFFYHEGTDFAKRGSALVIEGNGWSVEMAVPWIEGKYQFVLSNLLEVSEKQETNYNEYNEFLNKFMIARR